MPTTLVLADIHANAPALEAVLDAAPAYDRALFLGDAVDNGPHPDVVCDRLRELDPIAVSGNHDRSVLAADDANDPGDDPYWEWKEWTYLRLSEENRAFLASLPRTTTVAIGGRTLLLHHGDFPRPDGHDSEWRTRTIPEENPALFETIADQYDEDIVLLGHSHVPFEETVAGTTFLNPGSVGLQRAGWPIDVARYVTIVDGTIEFHEVRYDVDAVTRDARTVDSPFCDVWDRSSPVEQSE